VGSVCSHASELNVREQVSWHIRRVQPYSMLYLLKLKRALAYESLIMRRMETKDKKFIFCWASAWVDNCCCGHHLVTSAFGCMPSGSPRDRERLKRSLMSPDPCHPGPVTLHSISKGFSAARIWTCRAGMSCKSHIVLFPSMLSVTVCIAGFGIDMNALSSRQGAACMHALWGGNTSKCSQEQHRAWRQPWLTACGGWRTECSRCAGPGAAARGIARRCRPAGPRARRPSR
jgi:hypothetical protein